MHLGAVALPLDAGERIHIEDSYKYSVEGFRGIARAAGFRPGLAGVKCRSQPWWRPANRSQFNRA